MFAQDTDRGIYHVYGLHSGGLLHSPSQNTFISTVAIIVQQLKLVYFHNFSKLCH